MIKRIKHFFGLHPTLLSFIVLTLIVLISNGQTMRMYFWQDDSALMFKLQHIQEAAGSFGAGPFGDGPYKYLMTPFIPFFPLFGLNPTGYFVVGWMIYLIMTLIFYYFAESVFQNKKHALMASALFGAGYIGSDSLFRIINSWQTDIGVILALLCFWMQVKSIHKRSWKYYGASLFFFWTAIEFIYIRSHSLIFPIFFIDLLFLSYPYTKKFVTILLRQLPYFILFYIYYIKGATPGSNSLTSFTKDIIFENHALVMSLFATIGNLSVPSYWQQTFLQQFSGNPQHFLLLTFSILLIFSGIYWKSNKKIIPIFIALLFLAYLFNRSIYHQNLIWYRTADVYFAGSIGLYSTLFIFYMSYLLWKTHRTLSYSLLLGFIILESQIFGYQANGHNVIFDTTQRYLIHSLIGYALLFGTLCVAFYLNLNKRWNYQWNWSIGVAPLVLLVLSNLYLSVHYQYQFVRDKSIPAFHFYQQLQQEIKTLPKGAHVYFDIQDEGFVINQFNNFFQVGSMPETTALAIYFHVDRDDLWISPSFDDLLARLKQGKTSIDKVYTFYYSRQGLINTTDQTRTSLAGDRPVDINNLTLSSPIIDQAEVTILPDQQLKFPYTDPKAPQDKLNKFKDSNTFENKIMAIDYLLARQSYYQTASASSLSSWKYSEIPYILDDDDQTHWIGHRIYWNDNHHDQFQLDLGSIKLVDRFIWTNGHNAVTPLNYSISSSGDGKNWTSLIQVKNGKEKLSNQRIIEQFPETSMQYIRMDINETLANDSPAFSEVEAVESQYKDVDLEYAAFVKDHPFTNIQNQQQYQIVLDKIQPLLKISLTWTSDKGPTLYSKSLPLESLYTTDKYAFVLDPGGTILKTKSITIKNAPVSILVNKEQLHYASLQELLENGYIKNFVDN